MNDYKSQFRISLKAFFIIVLNFQSANSVEVTPYENMNCTDLRKELYNQNIRVGLKTAWGEYKELQQDYFDFYKVSKIDISIDYDSPYFNLPSPIPQSEKINIIMEIGKIKSPTAHPIDSLDKPLGHLPKWNISFPNDLGDRKDVMAKAAKIAQSGKKILSVINVVDKSWFELGDKILAWQKHLSKDSFEFEEGLKIYKQMMKEREVTLNNYLNYLGYYFCRKVITKEMDLRQFWDDTSTARLKNCSSRDRISAEGEFASLTELKTNQLWERAESFCKPLLPKRSAKNLKGYWKSKFGCLHVEDKSQSFTGKTYYPNGNIGVMKFDKIKDDFLFDWTNGKDTGTGVLERNGNKLSGYFLVAGQSNKIPWELESTTAANCGIPDFSAQKCKNIREKFDKEHKESVLAFNRAASDAWTASSFSKLDQIDKHCKRAAKYPEVIGFSEKLLAIKCSTLGIRYRDYLKVCT